MSFRSKLILLLVLVAVVPVSAAGLLSAQSNRRQMAETIAQFQLETAKLAAAGVDDFLLGATRSLWQCTQYIPFGSFSRQELGQALLLPYRQLEYLNVLALLDESGQQLCDPAYENDQATLTGLRSHTPIDQATLSAFAAHIPLKAALANERAFGPVYHRDGQTLPRVVLAMAFKPPEQEKRWVLASELSLRKIQDQTRALAKRSGGHVFLVDSQARVVTHSDESQKPGRDLSENPLVKNWLAGGTPAADRFQAEDGQMHAGAWAPVRSVGWGLVVAQPEARLFEAADRIRITTFYWMGICLLLAIFGGLLFARTIAGPIARLAEGARAIGQGDLEQRFDTGGGDEIGQLATTLTDMSTALKDSFAIIQDQNKEIQAWNKELLARVNTRTQELEQAQEQIIRSQKMAAVAELGAGLAHEVNNPLTAVLGFTQLLQLKIPKDDPKREMLDTVLAETRRIQTLIADLQRFSSAPKKVKHMPLSIDGLLDMTLRLVRSRLEAQGILVAISKLGEDAQILCDPTQLQQALIHIIDNALTAMPGGGTLTLTPSQKEAGAIKLTISDTGQGIERQNLSRIFEPFYTTKQEWHRPGLGLSVANQIVSEHDGKLLVDSQVGVGTTFSLIFPALRRNLHLK